MRNLLAAMCCACLALAASLADAYTTWMADDQGVLQVISNRSTRVASLPDVRKLAATGDGGAWAMNPHRLVRISRDGDVRADVDLSVNGYGHGVSLAVDPYDDSVWIGTDAQLLLHFSDNGSLAQGTLLSGVAEALVVALDQSPWLLFNGQVAHLDHDGHPGPSNVAVSAEVVSVGFAVDSLRDQVWIASPRALWQVQIERNLPVRDKKAKAGAMRAMALDVRSGELWSVMDQTLIAIERNGTIRLEIDSAVPLQDDSVTLHYDHEHETVLLQTASRFARISRDGQILEDFAMPPGRFLATPPPFRFDPTLALLRPPAGAATYDPSQELVLRVGATCNGTPCDPPARYADDLQVVAAMNGVRMSDPVVDPVTGRASVAPRVPMGPGVNRLTARAVDRFGHGAELEATLMLLDRTPDAPVASTEAQSVTTGGAAAPILKAPNKAPAVTLTSPTSGATFSAGASITIAAAASDPDGSIAKVEFYRAGTTLIGTATSAPYQFVWQNVAAGNYALTAKAFDNKNGTATSTPVSIAVTNNRLPAVALTSPAQGAFYAAGAPIQIAATASDPDGTVTKVEFLDGSVSIGVANNTPFAVAWAAATPGFHAIVARATDDKGGSSDSQSIDITVGQAPTVVVKNPVACSAVDGPLDLVLAADALSATGAIARVEFFDGETLVGTSYGAPWYVTLPAASPGDHSITARAVDDHGLAATSRPAAVTVRTANQAPSVSLTSPSEGARFLLGSTVNLASLATDNDGVVTAVEYRIGGSGGSLIGRATTTPYAVSWTNMAAGSYTLVAIAFDDRNATTMSAAVHVTIDPNILPSVAMTAPTANSRYTAPGTITLGANASDSNGSIAKVEFYAGTTLIGSSTTAPYAATWSSVPAGAYSLTAKATDNLGGIATSTPVPVTVANNAAPTVTLTAPAAGGQYFAPATISLSVSAADSDGTIARVEFYASGALIGTSTAAPYVATWDNVAGGTFLLTATATDNQGAATTSGAVAVVVNANATIEPSPGLDGSTIDDDTIVVSGVINAPANSGVLVNGVIAQIDSSGHFYANGVPLQPGANGLTITVASQDGLVATQTINISSNGPAPFSVTASPTDGFAPLLVTFQIVNRGNRAFQRLDFDYDGDGTTDYTAVPSQFSDGTLTLVVTYPAGTFTSRMTAYDQNSVVIQATTRIITARTLQQQDDLLKGVYVGMLNRLRAGRIADALNAITGDMRDKFSAVFTALGPELPAAVDGLGTLEPNWHTSDHAEYFVVRETPDGQQAFLIEFIRGQDGVWRIDGM